MVVNVVCAFTSPVNIASTCCMSFVSCIVMMSGWVLCTSFLVPRFCF